jgi:hypothetical protein
MRGVQLISNCGLFAAALLAAASRPVPAVAQADLQTYETKYYTLRTDLDRDGARAVVRHITLMAEEYNERTRGFGKSVDRRLPIYIVQNRAAYEALGGLKGTAGVFTGDKLMAVIDDPLSTRTWHVIQHEGFHQFAAAAIGRDLPVWANEGLAEYFGEGVFTGDAFYTGFIPAERLGDLKRAVRDHKLRPLREIMQMSHEIWNSTIGLAHDKAGNNYDQAWAMVQFLAHGEDGKYQEAFGNFLAAVARRQNWERAWVDNFGDDLQAFQERFDEYWLKLPDNPTVRLETEALVATVTSFYARAFSQRQSFETFQDFVAAAAAGQLQSDEEDWLAPEMLAQALKRVPEAGAWSLRMSRPQAVICETKDGAVFEGRFQIANRRVKSVEVTVKPGKKKP